MTTESLLRVRPRTPVPLDPDFIPAAPARRNYERAVKYSGAGVRLCLALERPDGGVCRSDLEIFPPDSPFDTDTLRYVERHVKFLLWSRGGAKLYLSGPEPVCRMLREQYAPGGGRAFDARRMEIVYDRPFEVVTTTADAVPEEREACLAVGGHWDGCRVGFDLGASDYKLAAVLDGRPVFTTEIPWRPSEQPDPEYHYSHIGKGLKLAAEHLPRVDAIGGSAAGAYVNNRVKYASLFRAVPEEAFRRRVGPLFLELQKEWGVPLTVLNDGEVTALAGALSLKKNALLGLAMGSSEAVGFFNRRGLVTGWYNELAYAPVDFNERAAPPDEVSGDVGCGALYFSQQAVAKMAPAAGFSFPEEMRLPERLKAVQEKADRGDEAALKVFTGIGVYLGYSVAHYADYYDFDHLLLLGRVTSGRGGEVVMEQAREVLRAEFPETAEKITLHVPDEKSRRLGQAVAAASLPKLS